MNDLVFKLVVAAVLLGLGALGIHEYNARLVREGEARAEAKWKPRAESAEAALEQSEKERTRYAEEATRLGGLARDARVQADMVRDANDRLVHAGERLRQQLAALRAAQGATKPTPDGGSQTADPAGDLQADVQRRLDQAADRIARFADESRIAGLTCQRAYEVKDAK